ncbi:4Fe-4S binding protein, partial [Thalassospira sp.]
CPESAIRIIPQLGGRARVLIGDDLCTGCGACFSACPVDAISIKPATEIAHG